MILDYIFSISFWYNNKVKVSINIQIRRLMFANETTVHKGPIDIEINNY